MNIPCPLDVKKLRKYFQHYYVCSKFLFISDKKAVLAVLFQLTMIILIQIIFAEKNINTEKETLEVTYLGKEHCELLVLCKQIHKKLKET